MHVKSFHSYFTDINYKLYTRNIRWQGVVEYLEVSGCKFCPIVRVERGLTIGGHFWLTRCPGSPAVRSYLKRELTFRSVT